MSNRLRYITLVLVSLASALYGAAQTAELDRAYFVADSTLRHYRMAEAQSHINSFSKLIAKGKEATDSTRALLSDLQRRLAITRNMLDRVEDVQIIDSLVVDADRFFQFYHLASSTGRFADASVLPNGAPVADSAVVFIPDNGLSMMWSAPDTLGVRHLAEMWYLGDGSLDSVELLKGDFNDGGNADYPFLMPDGVTLYFAADGQSSLGGYDIYMTRRDDDGSFLKPQNLGMPYNSAFNDYLMVIDEATGVGWWATDRAQIPGKVTIYIFIPTEMRVNIDPDRDDVVSLALIESIADTWRQGANYNELLQKIDDIQPAPAPERIDFEFYGPNGMVITSLSQVNDTDARRLLQQYLRAKIDADHAAERLQKLRAEYSAGNQNVATDILQLEKRTAERRAELLRLSNAVVSALAKSSR